MSENKDWDRTLVFPIRGDEILLGVKKQHHAKAFAVGKTTGFGGKVEAGETLEQAAIRELEEEAGIVATKLVKVAVNDFRPYYDMLVHVYFATEWQGEPRETDEMTVEWFNKNNLPYDRLWDDDKYWLPLALNGVKFTAKFKFEHSNDTDGTGENKTTEVIISPVESPKITAI